jgi:hypothetical protein
MRADVGWKLAAQRAIFMRIERPSTDGQHRLAQYVKSLSQLNTLGMKIETYSFLRYRRDGAAIFKSQLSVCQ